MKLNRLPHKIRSILAGLLLVFVLATTAGAQPPTEGRADWRAVASSVEGEEGLYEVLFEARLTPGWHIFDLGPYAEVPELATSFDFSASKGVELVGEPYPVGEPIRKYSDIFGFETVYFEMIGRFAQKVRALKPGAMFAGEIDYQICNVRGQCIRRQWEFVVPLGKAGEMAAGNGAGTQAGPGSPEAGQSGGWFWSMFILAVVSALGALGTPCVFPMIPMTVSFFLKGGDDPVKARFRALMFGVFIVAIYTLPIAVLLLAARFGGGEALTADIFNWLATHWIPNVLFFVIFMIFAASLLGAFEIRLPGRLVNRSDKNADRAGMAGVFFLALTLVLVSFSCTLPIVGGALVQSMQGEFWRPIATMLLFSIVFALPFTFFAFFPRLMERLPRSGGWLNSVKVILGLVEIALGLKFLSVAPH